MQAKKLSPFDAIRNGVKLILDNFYVPGLATLITFSIIILVIFLCLSPFLRQHAFVSIAQHVAMGNIGGARASFNLILKQTPQLALIFGLFLMVLYFSITWLGLGLMLIMLELHQTGKSAVKRLFSVSMLTTLKAFVAALLYSTAVVVGLMLFVLPGIYIALKLAFFPYLILDRDAGIIESLQKSFAMTNGSFWDLSAIGIVFGMISMLANSVPFGFMLTAPVGVAIMVYAYKALSE